MKDFKIFRDGWKLNFKHCAHENIVTRELTQPDRDLILTRNANLRNNPGAINDLSFGRQMLSVPLEDMEMLRRKHPELRTTDSQIRSDWWKKFILSPESLPYRTS